MATWNGTFELTKMENVAPFLKALGLSDAEVIRLSNFKYDVQLTKNGNDFKMKQLTTEKEVLVDFSIGKEFEFTTIEGIEMKGKALMPDDRTLHGKFQGGLEEYVVLQDDGNLTDTFSKRGIKYTRLFTRK